MMPLIQLRAVVLLTWQYEFGSSFHGSAVQLYAVAVHPQFSTSKFWALSAQSEVDLWYVWQILALSLTPVRWPLLLFVKLRLYFHQQPVVLVPLSSCCWQGQAVLWVFRFLPALQWGRNLSTIVMEHGQEGVGHERLMKKIPNINQFLWNTIPKYTTGVKDTTYLFNGLLTLIE